MARSSAPRWPTADRKSRWVSLPDNAKALEWAEIAGLIEIARDGSWRPSAPAKAWLSQHHPSRSTRQEFDA